MQFGARRLRVSNNRRPSDLLETSDRARVALGNLSSSPCGAALVVAYAVTLRLLSEDIAEAERRLRLGAPGPDRALVVSEHQPRLVEAAERAHVIGLALSAVSPASLSPSALAEQRRETLRWIDLSAMRGRIDREGH